MASEQDGYFPPVRDVLTVPIRLRDPEVGNNSSTDATSRSPTLSKLQVNMASEEAFNRGPTSQSLTLPTKRLDPEVESGSSEGPSDGSSVRRGRVPKLMMSSYNEEDKAIATGQSVLSTPESTLLRDSGKMASRQRRSRSSEAKTIVSLQRVALESALIASSKYLSAGLSDSQTPILSPASPEGSAASDGSETVADGGQRFHLDIGEALGDIKSHHAITRELDNYFPTVAAVHEHKAHGEKTTPPKCGPDNLRPASPGYLGSSDSTPFLARTGTRKLSPSRFTTSHLSAMRPLSPCSVTEEDEEVDEWDADALLEFSDTLRQVVRESTIPDNLLADLDALLAQMLLDESFDDRAMELSMIVYVRWDKLLTEVLRYLKHYTNEELFSKASALEHKWRNRFTRDYFDIDDKRLAILKNAEGRLKNMSLVQGERVNDHMWKVKRKTPFLEQPEDLIFKPGDWWLSILCAYRDGLIDKSDERVSRGKYGISAIPLLTGREVEGKVLGTIKYIKEGPNDAMHFSLMSQVGRNVRVLRGYKLESQNAPTAGIRYDGLYRVVQYGHSLTDPGKNTYRCTITLDRLPDQATMYQIQQIPTHSQRDDWLLYNKLIEDDIRKREGDAAYRNWKTAEREEERQRGMRRIRDEWERMHKDH